MRNPKKQDENELNINELMFIENLLQGYTQRQSYWKAYPSSRNSKEQFIDTSAYLLFKKPKIRNKYNELLEIQREEIARHSIWTREQAMTEIKHLYENNKREADRYEIAYTEEIELLEKQIKERQEQIDNPKGYLSRNKKYKLEQEIDELKMAKIRCNRRHQSNKSVNDAMLQSIIQLNEMMGFNEPEKKTGENNDVLKIQFVDNIGKENKEEVKA